MAVERIIDKQRSTDHILGRNCSPVSSIEAAGRIVTDGEIFVFRDGELLADIKDAQIAVAGKVTFQRSVGLECSSSFNGFSIKKKCGLFDF